MSKEFKFKLEKNTIKLNPKTTNLKNLTLKLKGQYGKNKIIFSSYISIKFDTKDITLIKNIKVKKLDIIDSSEEYSDTINYGIYNINIEDIFSSDEHECAKKYSSEIYDQLILFIKNIKIFEKNNKICLLIFNLKKTEINKMKIRGKIN